MCVIPLRVLPVKRREVRVAPRKESRFQKRHVGVGEFQAESGQRSASLQAERGWWSLCASQRRTET